MGRLVWSALGASVGLEGKPCVKIAPGSPLGERCGVFVTLRCGETLRGCVGTVQATEPLAVSVVEKAISAALHDSRFPPLAANELDSLHVEVSLLSALERLQGAPADIRASVRPGTHGLYLRRGTVRGLLLPQVCTAYGWDAGEFLRQTAWKAGMGPEEWQDPACEVFVFTVECFEAERPHGALPDQVG